MVIPVLIKTFVIKNHDQHDTRILPDNATLWISTDVLIIEILVEWSLLGIKLKISGGYSLYLFTDNYKNVIICKQVQRICKTRRIYFITLIKFKP